MSFVSPDSVVDDSFMADSPIIERALISVSDKSGLIEFANALAELGIEIFSTGGTRRHLFENGISAVDISDYTGFPEIMDGRVKTLHPKIFGGILCRRDNSLDIKVTRDLQMLPFELVVVNLYPFAETIARPDITEQLAIENIDIGGPSLVRAAAKNNAFVTIATDPRQYPEILDQIKQASCTAPELRRRLMAQAFEHTSRYDQLIANYFSEQPAPQRLPASIELSLQRHSKLRYGENSHQDAAVYELPQGERPNLVHATKRHGKELSYNNYLDLDAALAIVSSFHEPACAVIKHNNPCGAATGGSLVEICQRSIAGDPQSAFGSIVGFNRSVDAATADYMASGDLFVEAILAPAFDEDAFDILVSKPKWRKNVRLLTCGMGPSDAARLSYRQIHGGMLVQQADTRLAAEDNWKTATDRSIDPETMRQLSFAWQMVRFVKSNAIVLANDRSLCGVGAGQMSRVDSVRIAISKAGERSRGSVMASDAFFPFPDSIEIASQAGVVAVIQPGGSVKDDEVVEACQQFGIDMVFTGRRHFWH